MELVLVKLNIASLIEKLEKNNKISQILVTSSTLSSSKILKNLSLKLFINFSLLIQVFTQIYFKLLKPDLAVFVDSEIWPNMLLNLKKKILL